MAAPVPEIYVPTNLTPRSAFFHGECRSMGGLPTQFCFSYRNPFWWKSTPWQNVNHDGQEFDVNVTGIGWDLIPLPWGMKMQWGCQVKAWAKNADRSVMTKPISFWLPKPTKPQEGAPWVIVRQGGYFEDMIYIWQAESDIGCLLHVLVGTRKPYISPTVHITRGVVFHHDAELWFTWKWRIDSEQTIDTLLHDFHIPFFEYDRKYWFVAMGSVDGKNSPSISPPFSFRMCHPPKMATDDAYDITHNSAKLPGHLVDDYGMPAYVRFNYGKKPNYTHNTPTLGPESSPYDYVEEIDGLQPNTWYRFRAEGSHDEGFPTHGLSYPKDFLTLPSPVQDYEKNSPKEPYSRISSSSYEYSCPEGQGCTTDFIALSTHLINKVVFQAAQYSTRWPKIGLNPRLYRANSLGYPYGDALTEGDVPIGQIGGVDDPQIIECSVPSYEVQEGLRYAWVFFANEQGAPMRVTGIRVGTAPNYDTAQWVYQVRYHDFSKYSQMYPAILHFENWTG